MKPLTRERKPLPEGVRGGAVADVMARRNERSLPKPTASAKPWLGKVAGSRSRLTTTLRNTDQLPQRIVLLMGAVAVALNTLFPPWVYILKLGNELNAERFAGYHFILGSNQPDAGIAQRIFHEITSWPGIVRYITVRLDTPRLFAQLVGILCLIALFYFGVRARARVAHSNHLLNAGLDEKCPVDGAQMVKRRGEFISCSNYPKCKYIAP